MDTLATFLSEQTIQRIGWVLIHFLWQGVAVAALMWCAMKMLRKASANLRYIAACAGLVLMVLASVVTFMMQDGNTAATVPESIAIETPFAPVAEPPVTSQNIVIPYAEPTALPELSLIETLTVQLESALPYCVIGWAVGVVVLSVWYLGGWCQLQKLRRIGTKAVSDAVAQKTSEFANRLGVHKCVRIAESALVQIPTVIGWLKPVILLPATALIGLDEMQLKAMIAHELAHIKRCDYLVNIVQTVVEILGFYHPAVWWISRQIRVERENCCDDMAVEVLEDRKEYAKALFSMEAVRAKQLDLAIAANGGHLQSRIGRLVGKNAPQHQKSGWIPSVITMIVVMLLFSSVLVFKSASAEKELIRHPSKQEITALFQQVDNALRSNNSDAIDKYLYFENETVRQKVFGLLAQQAPDKKGMFTPAPHILDIIAQPNDTYEVFTLFSPNRNLYMPQTFIVILNEHQCKLNLFTQETVDQAEMAKTLSPQEMGKIHLEKDLNEWKKATREGWQKFIQSQIQKEQQNLAAYRYAQSNNLPLEPHLTIENITQNLDIYKNTPPEQLRQIFIEDYSETLDNLKQTNSMESASSKISKKTAPIEDEEQEMQTARLRSMSNLKQLGLACHMYVDDNDDTPAFSMNDLKPYLESDNYLWLKDHTVLLIPDRQITDPGKTLVAYDKTFLKKYGRRIIVFADGHVEIDTKDDLKDVLDKAIDMSDRVNAMVKLKELGLELWSWASEHDDAFPDSVEQIEFENEVLKDWAKENVEYLAGGKIIAEIKDSGKEIIAYDKNLSKTDNGTNLLFADGHVEFVENENLKDIISVDKEDNRPQILTTGYIVSVPVDLPELKGIMPEKGTENEIIPPEKLEAFLDVVRTTPQAKIIAAPKLLTNDGEAGEIRTENTEDFESIKLNIKNTVQPDEKTLMTKVDFEYSRSVGQDVSKRSVMTTATILSGNAIAIGGGEPDNGVVLLLVQPKILEGQFSKTGIVQTESLNNEKTIETQSILEIQNIRLEPVAQGKNILWITVENTADKAKFFSVNIYTRSVDYGTQGVGWGTNFYEKFAPGEMKKLRYAYKIQGPVTENTYVRLSFYNAVSLNHDENKDLKHFARKVYKSGDLTKREPSKELKPVTESQFEALSAALKTVQSHICKKEYEKAWDLFTEDHKQAEYQTRGIEAFKRQMEPEHPLHSAFTWEKTDFLKLESVRAYEKNGVLEMHAACGSVMWVVDFIKKDNVWRIHWIAGYSPKVLDMQEADNRKKVK